MEGKRERGKDVLAASGKSLIVGGTDCAARIGEFEGVGGGEEEAGGGEEGGEGEHVCQWWCCCSGAMGWCWFVLVMSGR